MRIHFSFLLLAAYLSAEAWQLAGGSGLAVGLCLGALFTGCIALQGLLQTLMARFLGVGIKEVRLLPIGVMVRYRGEPGPRREFAMALVSPIFHLALAGLFHLLGGPAAPGMEGFSWPELAFEPGGVFAWVAQANLALGLLNLVPAFPLAGARMLRALLGLTAWKARVPVLSAATSLACGLGLAAGGLWVGNPALFMAGSLVFFVGESERQRLILVSSWQGLKVGDVFVRPAASSWVTESMAEATAKAVHAGQAWHPLMASDKSLAGLVSLEDLIRLTARSSPLAPVGWALKRTPQVRVGRGQDLPGVMEQLVSDGLKAVAVYDGKRFVGVLDRDALVPARIMAGGLKTWAFPRASLDLPVVRVGLP